MRTATERRGGRPRKEEAARRVEHLLDTAAGIFIRDGYAGASIDRIALEAGVGKPTIYARFESKANLLKRVIEHLLARLVVVDDRIEARTAEEALKEQLANIITVSIEPAFLGILRLFMTEASKFPEIFSAFHATTERSQRLLVKQLAQYPEFADTTVPHEEIASMLISMAGGLILVASAKQEMDTNISPQRDAAWIVDVILHGVLRLSAQ